MIAAALKAGGALSALSAYNQFILVRLVPDNDRPGKTYKFPVALSDTDKACDAHNPANWLSAERVLSIVEELGPSFCVGFVFTEHDPFFFIDIDSAYDSIAGWSALATQFANDYKGCAVEVSQSCKGLHIIGTYCAKPEHSCKNIALGIECYTEGRFVALTGYSAHGDALNDATLQLHVTALTHFAPGVDKAHDWTDKPIDSYGPELADDVLIERAMRAQSAGSTFGTKASFRDLFRAKYDKLSEVYPHEVNGYDRSSADAALASILAFWTGKNCEQMQRIMLASALKRDKWTYHRTYLYRTITSACARQGESVYQQRGVRDVAKNVAPPVGMVPTVDYVESSPGLSQNQAIIKLSGQWMNAEAQIDFFAGCVYVQDIDRILVPSGALLKQSQFKSVYGGYLFEFARGIKPKDKTNAWEVFTESQVVNFPKAETTMFNPLKPFGVVDDGAVNIFIPKWGKRVKGDPSPFINHVTKLIPNEKDREILLSFMAAMVQLAGEKFQWCPVIQGVQGNGKTILINCIEYCVGEKYTHRPKGAKIGANFNGWMRNKLFIGVEEIHVSDRVDLSEFLKDYVSNPRLEIENKGVDQETGKICCNYIMLSNHKDAVMKTCEDRRYAPFYTAQQEREDKIRDGLTDDYFIEFRAWLNDGGFGIVAEYLWTRPITCNVFGHAPDTSNTKEAIQESLGALEETIADAIDRCEPGMTGDIILNQGISAYLERRGKLISPKRIGYMMRAIGYIRPDSLKTTEGKLSIDGKRHRCYVRKGSAAEAMNKEELEIAYKRQVNSLAAIAAFPPLQAIPGGRP